MVATRSGARKKAPEVEVPAASTLNAPPKRAATRKRKAAEDAPAETASKTTRTTKAEPKAMKPAASTAAPKTTSKAPARATRTTRTRKEPDATNESQSEPQPQPQEALQPQQPAAEKPKRGRKAAPTTKVEQPVSEPAKKVTRGRKPTAAPTSTVLEPIEEHGPAPGEPVKATRGRKIAPTSTSTLKAPARKAAIRKPKVTAQPAPEVSEEPLAEFPNYPSTPAHIKAPLSNADALAELAKGYPSTPAHIKAPLSNANALAELVKSYPSTPAHIQAPLSNTEALAELAKGYPTTPAHIKAPLSNTAALAELAKSYPSTPAHIQATLSNVNAFAEIAQAYPSTPAHIKAPLSNAEGLAELAKGYPTTPAHIKAPLSSAEALAELAKSYPSTPAHIKAPISNADALAELAKGYPTTPAHIKAPMSNAEGLIELAKAYPTTPAHIKAPLSNAEALAELAKSYPSTPAHIQAPVPAPPKQIELPDNFEETIQDVLGSRLHTPDVDDSSTDMEDISFESSQISSPAQAKENESLKESPAAANVVSPVMLAPSLPAPVPASPTKSALRSPLKTISQTPKKVVTWQEESESVVPSEDEPLRGMTFFVDVMSNGRDQSFLFTTLLEDLGAKVVPDYNEHTYLTHVLWKEGKMSTLELVADSHGKVKCVNVGWVLDSEKNKKRMDETPYLVDLSWFAAKSAPFTPAKTPSRWLATYEEKSSSIKAIPNTPTSSEFDRSINFDDKENSELGIYFQDYAKTAPRPKASWLTNKSPLKTPSKPSFLLQQPIKAFSTAKKRDATESFGNFAMAPPKKLRFV